MEQASVTWYGGKHFVGTDSTQHSVVLSTKEDGVGMRPSELLLVALASCTSVDVVEILAKKRTPLSGLEVQVSGEQDPNPPWPFLKIHLKYILTGQDLQEKDVVQAIELSEQKYCSVAATVRGVAHIDYTYEIRAVQP
jgi:putative redox protein